MGQGKTGKVFYAQDPATLENVAIKVIQREYLCTESRVQALEQEIEILSNVSHPYILQLLKVYRCPQHIALVTPVLHGGEVMKRATLDEFQVRRIIRDIANTLVYLHAKGITHRDVKPENMMFSSTEPDSPVILIDFGVSHVGKEMTGLAGTGHYMAPETFQRDSVYGCEIDIWSLGISTYVLLTSGSYPFDAPFLSQIEDQIATAQVSFPSDCPLMSQEAKDFVEFLLIKNAKQRPNANQVLNHPWLREMNDGIKN